MSRKQFLPLFFSSSSSMRQASISLQADCVVQVELAGLYREMSTSFRVAAVTSWIIPSWFTCSECAAPVSHRFNVLNIISVDADLRSVTGNTRLIVTVCLDVARARLFTYSEHYAAWHKITRTCMSPLAQPQFIHSFQWRLWFIHSFFAVYKGAPKSCCRCLSLQHESSVCSIGVTFVLATGTRVC